MIVGPHYQAGSFPATAAHPGGVNVLMMDGNARFVRVGIAPAHWWALSTIAGGEVVAPLD
jgi:prepilin-type processing-associated H-X9-DG protein